MADQHDNTLLTGGPYAVGSDNFFDILRRQQEDNPPQPYGAGATQEPHYRDAPPPRYSSGSSKFAKNKFSGHYFSSGGGEEAQQQRPNTTTGVSRNPSRAASATQLGATRSGTANAALHHKDNHHHQQQQHKQQKRLDFQNLFADQPAAGYFPVLKTGQMAAADLAAHSASSKANDWLDEFLPPGSRGQSAGGGGAARGVGGSGSGRGSARGSGSAKIKVSEDFGTYMDLSDGWFGGDERPKSATFATSPKDQPVAGGAGYQDRVSNSAPVSTAPMFPSGESVSSNSYLSENRSIAHNKAASVSDAVYVVCMRLLRPINYQVRCDACIESD